MANYYSCLSEECGATIYGMGLDSAEEEFKRRLAERRAAKAAVEPEKKESKERESEDEVRSAHINLEKERRDIEKERAEFEKLKKSLGNVIGAAEGMRALKMNKEIFNCPICKRIISSIHNQDVCIGCNINFIY